MEMKMNKGIGKITAGADFVGAGGGNGNTVSWASYYPQVTVSINNRGLEPIKIIYNGKVTIVYWNDNTRNVSTCSENEVFDPEIGFAMCLLKKMYGKKVYGKKLYRRMISKAQKYEKQHTNSMELPF